MALSNAQGLGIVGALFALSVLWCARHSRRPGRHAEVLRWMWRHPRHRLLHLVVCIAHVCAWPWRTSSGPPTVAATCEAAVKANAEGHADFGDDFHETVLAATRQAWHAWFPLGTYLPFAELLQRKLNITALLQAEPAVADVPLRPVWIVGLPRTGSTLLHHLLALDPAARSCRAWELREPTPPPAPDTPEDDPRVLKVRKMLENTYKVFPLLKGIHRIRAEGPDECVEGFMDLAMPQQFLWGAQDMPEVFEWYMGLDSRPQYANYRRLLQALCWKFPERSHLVLKSPHHTAKLADIAAEFPGSTFVWLHRRPASVAGSTCSMNLAISDYFNTAFAHRHDVGQRTLQRLARVMAQGLAQRDALEAQGARFVDVYYTDLKADAHGAVRALYGDLGLPYSDELDAAITGFFEQQAEERKGTKLHAYTLEEFGLDEEVVNAAFGEYLGRFPRALE